MLILNGIVTAGFLNPCAVRLQAIGKTKESWNHVLCPQDSMNWWYSLAEILSLKFHWSSGTSQQIITGHYTDHHCNSECFCESAVLSNYLSNF